MSEHSIELSGGTVEVDDIAGCGSASAPLVFLHEGLGSISAWRDVPQELARLTGRRVVTYSRFGYGWSSPALLPRRPGYMHAEAEVVLPELLEAMGLDPPVLVGHSDGASIALLYAAGGRPLKGVVALSPHVFVEECTVKGALEAREAYLHGDLRERLGRHHRDVDAAFYGWNDIWLSDSFRSWSIEERLGAVTVPLLLVQCRDDPYGTLEQLDRIDQAVAGPVDRLVLPTGGHAPQRAERGQVLRAISVFADRF